MPSGNSSHAFKMSPRPPHSLISEDGPLSRGRPQPLQLVQEPEEPELGPIFALASKRAQSAPPVTAPFPFGGLASSPPPAAGHSLLQLREAMRAELTTFQASIAADTRRLLEESWCRHTPQPMSPWLHSRQGTPQQVLSPGCQTPEGDNANSRRASKDGEPDIVDAVLTMPTGLDSTDLGSVPETGDGTQDGRLSKSMSLELGAFALLDTQDDIDPKTTEDALYYRTGTLQRIARHYLFMHATFLCILINSVYIGYDAEVNREHDMLWKKPVIFVVVENWFCLFFTAEIIIRFAACREKVAIFFDGWFRFDAILVVLMIAEVWGTGLVYLVSPTLAHSLPMASLRVLRLMRVPRLPRVMRRFPELLTLIRAMRVACRAVISTLVMICLFIYMFAMIIMSVLTTNDISTIAEHEEHQSYFTSMLDSMWTLMIDGTLLNDPGLVVVTVGRARSPTGVMSILIFMCFLVLSAVTLMNMLVGVMCEVMSAVASHERDEADLRLMKKTIYAELKKFDEDGNGMISNEELTNVIQNPQALEVLHSLNIDVDYLADVQQMMFPTQLPAAGEPNEHVTKDIPIEKTIEMMLMCRGHLPVTVKNLVQGHFVTRWLLYSTIKQSFQKGFEHMQAPVPGAKRRTHPGHHEHHVPPSPTTHKINRPINSALHVKAPQPLR